MKHKFQLRNMALCLVLALTMVISMMPAMTLQAHAANPTVLIDVGNGHANLFTSDVLNQIKTEFELEDVTISGNVITLKGVNPSTTEYDMWGNIDNFVDNLVEAADYMHNKESFRVPAYKPIDEYSTDNDLENDIFNETHESTQVSDNLTYYLFWAKPYEKLEIDNGNPTCGKEMWRAFPEVPSGFMVDPEDSYWVDENDEVVEKFEGGKTYTFKGRIYHRTYGELWKYFIDPDNFSLTVEGGKNLDYSIRNDWITLSYTATANHDWDEGKVTKAATCGEKGEKTFSCKAEGCKATKTEAIPATGKHTWDSGKVTKKATEKAKGVKTYTCTVCKAIKTESIPKLAPKKAKTKPVIVAKGIANGNKAVNVSWNKVTGADRYVIYLAKCKHKGKEHSFKKVKTVSGKTLKWTKSKLSKNTGYKFYVVAQKKSGKSYKTIVKSRQAHFFTGNLRDEYTNPKILKLTKSSLSIKKGGSATIKATVSKVDKSKKLATSHAAKLRYISNNPTVATVSAKGKVTAKAKGTATIYVQTINGIWKTCKVTVR